MLKRPAALAQLLIALFVCTILIALMGSGSQNSDSTTADDLQKQLSEQFVKQWTANVVESIEIDHFERPSAENELVIGLRIQWNQQNSTSTAVTLYRVAGRYYVGTFRLNGESLPAHLQERARSLRSVRILLSFKA